MNPNTFTFLGYDTSRWNCHVIISTRIFYTKVSKASDRHGSAPPTAATKIMKQIQSKQTRSARDPAFPSGKLRLPAGTETRVLASSLMAAARHRGRAPLCVTHACPPSTSRQSSAQQLQPNDSMDRRTGHGGTPYKCLLPPAPILTTILQSTQANTRAADSLKSLVRTTRQTDPAKQSSTQPARHREDRLPPRRPCKVIE